MANLLLSGLKQAFFFSYGLFTLFYYWCSAVALGYFFKRPDEKENLELKLGTYTYISSLNYLPSPPMHIECCRRSIVKLTSFS